MEQVTVIAAQGATVRGPAKLKLDRKQWARRAHVLGPVPKKLRTVELDGGQALQFKQGERFGLEQPEGRLSRAHFAFAAPATDPEDAPDAEPEAEGDDAAAAGAGAAVVDSDD